MMKRALLVAALTLPVATANAEDMPVYESLSGLDIGRVFLTQAQRDALDRSRARGDGYAETSVKPRGTASPTTASPDAAGYIISDSGETRIWKRGDFVAGEPTDADGVEFPGEVRVKKHEQKSRDE